MPAPVTSHLLLVGDAAAVDNESSWSEEHRPDDAVLFDPRRIEVHHVGGGLISSDVMPAYAGIHCLTCYSNEFWRSPE
jgi:hypothetical protein